MFIARYAPSPYITQLPLVLKGLMAYREITYVYFHNYTKAADATSNKTQRYLLLRQVQHTIATKIKDTVPAPYTSLNKTANDDKKLLHIDVGLLIYGFILVVFSARAPCISLLHVIHKKHQHYGQKFPYYVKHLMKTTPLPHFPSP